MKKSIVLAMSLVAPAFAGESAPVAVTPLTAPAVAAPAAAVCPLSWELAGVYRNANRDLFAHSGGAEKDIDTYGVDLTSVYGLTDNWALNLRFGYTFGDEVEKYWGGHYETDIHTFYLMPGVRYTAPICDNWSVYAGANIGIANESVKDHCRVDDYVGGAHDSDWGFAYSAEVGLRYQVSENTEIFAAYEFFGSTATPNLYDGGVLDTHQQTYSGVRAGVSIKF